MVHWCTIPRKKYRTPPRKIKWLTAGTWGTRPWRRKIIFQTINFSFYVDLAGCNWMTPPQKKKRMFATFVSCWNKNLSCHPGRYQKISRSTYLMWLSSAHPFATNNLQKKPPEVMYEFVPLIKGLFISIGNVTSEPTIDFQWTCLCLVVNSEIIFRFTSPNVQGKKSPKIHHLPGKIEKNTNPDLPQRTRRNHYYLLGWGRVLDEITNILGPWLAWTHTLSLYIYIQYVSEWFYDYIWS